MFTAVIKCGKNTLVTEIPTSTYSLSVRLGSIGINIPATEIPVSGNESIEVQLVPNEEIGTAIFKRLLDNDTLSELNIACQLINQCMPYGYSEFLDMLDPKPQGIYSYYKAYETILPSVEHGIKGIFEEIRRYNVTMKSYQVACEAEQEPDNQADNEEWER